MIKHPIIDSLKPSVMKFDLARMRKVMAALGDPQDRFRSVHIAGTNGKGSVTAMIANALTRAGLRVGMYTSPHLENINERFQINGRMISDRDLDRLSRTLFKKFPHLTQFEFLTLVAFVWFAENNIDVAVVETGLGGRLDATNILKNVLVSVITNIDYDHMNWLGNTLEKIAREKAGIIKRGVPVITGADGAAWRVIAATARRRNAEIVRVSKPAAGLKLRLPGAHQRKNAALALRALKQLKPVFENLTDRAIRSGVSDVRWPGRFELFLLGSGRSKRTVILDGAHNAAGCRVLSAELKRRKLAPVHFLFGVLKDKDMASMVNVLAPLAARAIVVPVASERSASPLAVAALPGWRASVETAESVGAGWRKILSLKDGRPVVVAGSLYLVGDIRRRLS